MSFIKSQYPIICAAMNRVSDVKLALAVAKAGCVPSLVVHNYIESELDNDISKVINEMEEFTALAGSTEFILALRSDLLLKAPRLVAGILKHHPDYLELFDDVDVANSKLTTIIKLFRKSGIKIIYKVLGTRPIGELVNYIDALVVKGPDAAARVGKLPISLLDKVTQLKTTHNHLSIIASGGISSFKDIQDCLEAGASAVSLGTVFAVSVESSISEETKLKMIAATFDQVQNIGSARQNALVFTNEEDVDGNHTRGLEMGIKSPTCGHIFVGKAIDTIDTIRPVIEIVAKLTS